MGRDVGAKKPSESQKAKALSAMQAAKDRGEVYHDLARKEDMLGRTKTRLELWDEHRKDPIIALDKALKCLENPSEAAIGSRRLVDSRLDCSGLQLCGYRDFAKDVERAPLERRLALPGPSWNVPGKYGPLGELPLPCQDGVGGFLKRSAVRASGPCGNAQGVYADWTTFTLWQQKVKPDQAVVLGRNGSGLARQARSPLAVRSLSTTTSAGPLKSSDRIGQGRWWRSFSRTGSSGE